MDMRRKKRTKKRLFVYSSELAFLLRPRVCQCSIAAVKQVLQCAEVLALIWKLRRMIVYDYDALRMYIQDGGS